MENCALTSPAALLAATGLPVRCAFTVIELLVAIGAVAIVTVGLAAIFDAVGKTVQGGKRASALSQYATMVENQLRIDVSSIDPNSFMVIRQQFVDVNNDEFVDGNDAAVQLYPNQTTGLRPRRIDELMFFAQGDLRRHGRRSCPIWWLARASACTTGMGRNGTVLWRSRWTMRSPSLASVT